VVPTWERIAAGVVIGACAAAFAMLEVFLVPMRIGTTPFPLAIVLAVVVNVLAPALMHWATEIPMTSFVPAVVWFLVVGPGTVTGPGGDVLIPGTWQGVTFLLAGVAAIVAGLVLDAIRTTRAAAPAAGRSRPS
jgi:hypothetical protein